MIQEVFPNICQNDYRWRRGEIMMEPSETLPSKFVELRLPHLEGGGGRPYTCLYVGVEGLHRPTRFRDLDSKARTCARSPNASRGLQVHAQVLLPIGPGPSSRGQVVVHVPRLLREANLPSHRLCHGPLGGAGLGDSRDNRWAEHEEEGPNQSSTGGHFIANQTRREHEMTQGHA